MTALLPGPAVGTWTVDPIATRAEFRARDLLRKTVIGTLPVLSARVEVAEGGVTVVAELDLSGVATGISKRDADLRGRRFFDVAQHPVLRVEASGPVPGPEGTSRLTGQLLLKGGSCSVEVDVRVSHDEGPVRVRATTTLDRRDAGIQVPRLLVGTRVDVDVDAVLLPVAPAASGP